jgi:NADPH-dependent 2,4-dienoyl-CoA reductase/sulfur reductase-like enzyme/ferredoxin
MRVVVDLTKCEGYAQCAFAAPDVFTMRGDEALMYDPNPSDAVQVLRAAAACPVGAIQVESADGPPRPAAAITGDGPDATFKRTGRIVIVGASLAGLRAAETLRSEGFRGHLTLIGDEPHEPYDRPPLSKQALTGAVSPEHTALPRRVDVDAQWRLGVPATGLDLAGKRVRLADGAQVDFDRLLIATGVRARPWPNAAEAALDGVLVLRTNEDAGRLRARLDAKPGRVLVIGAGFTGSEVASCCRQLELPVTVAELGPSPLVSALGGVIGAIAADVQRDNGVDLRCEVRVTALEGDADGRLHAARLSTGDTIDVDVAVVALGSIRNVEWLQGSGLAVGPWGLACDTGCRVADINGLVTDDVFVAGDVARAPHPIFGYQFVTLEHWGNARAQAEVAAHNMISTETNRWPNLAMPVFWSNQFGINIKSVGVPPIADQVAITQGSVAERRFVATYGYKGRIVAAVSFNQGKWLDFYQDLIDRAAPFPLTFDTVDQPTQRQAVAAGFPERTFPAHDATVVVTGHEPSERRATLVQSS